MSLLCSFPLKLVFGCQLFSAVALTGLALGAMRAEHDVVACAESPSLVLGRVAPDGAASWTETRVSLSAARTSTNEYFYGPPQRARRDPINALEIVVG